MATGWARLARRRVGGWGAMTQGIATRANVGEGRGQAAILSVLSVPPGGGLPCNLADGRWGQADADIASPGLGLS